MSEEKTHKPVINKADRARFNEAMHYLGNKGWSLRKALKKVKLSSKTFYKWLDQLDEDTDEIKAERLLLVKQYTRACEDRADTMAEKTHIIAKKAMDKKVEPNAARLAIDALKWHAGKLRPNKYGNQIDITSGGERVNTAVYEVREVIVTESEKADQQENEDKG